MKVDANVSIGTQFISFTIIAVVAVIIVVILIFYFGGRGCCKTATKAVAKRKDEKLKIQLTNRAEANAFNSNGDSDVSVFPRDVSIPPPMADYSSYTRQNPYQQFHQPVYQPLYPSQSTQRIVSIQSTSKMPKEMAEQEPLLTPGLTRKSLSSAKLSSPGGKTKSLSYAKLPTYSNRPVTFKGGNSTEDTDLSPELSRTASMIKITKTYSKNQLAMRQSMRNYK